MNQELPNAHWIHSKKKADLILNDKSIIEIEFTNKVAFVKIGKQKLEMKTKGFWFPKIIISQKDKILSTQKQIGIWGTRSEFVIDDHTFIASTKLGRLFNIIYADAAGDVLTYKLDAVKAKPIFTFEIKNFDIPEQHLLLLLALGFYSIKNVAVEAMSNDFIISAVA